MSPPPPPAIRGIISGAIFAGILAALFLTYTPPAEAQVTRTLTLSATGNNGDRDPATPGLEVDEGDQITITITLSGCSDGQVATQVTNFAGGTAATDADFRVAAGTGAITNFPTQSFDARNGRLTGFHRFDIVADGMAESAETIVLPVPMLHPFTTTTDTIVRGDPLTITIRANDVNNRYVPPAVVTPDPGPAGPATDNPAARADRLDAPMGAVARGVGMLAAEAVGKRLHAVATANQLNIGRATTADELLHGGSFNLAGGDGGRGFSVWGGGGHVSAEGDHDGVDYDGDTSAFTLGIDTNWRDGLVGVAVSRSDGDVDFTDTTGMESTLEIAVTGVHPYLTRRLNRSQLWLTAGHGSGDAELKEPDAVIKTDLTVTTAAFGITHARGELFTAGLSALYSRAKLDAATGGGKTLSATAADTLRITASGEAGWTRGAWRPFITLRLRHDSGDGDTGGAADLGGGVEWRAPTVLVRLAGSGHIQGQAADEQRASLTVRKSSGNFDLGLNLGADSNGLDTARLLTGEWRF